MCAAKGVAVIEQIMVIRKIQSGQEQRNLFAERFRQSNVKGGVVRQVRRAVAVENGGGRGPRAVNSCGLDH